MPARGIDYKCSRCGRPTRLGRWTRGLCPRCYRRQHDKPRCSLSTGDCRGSRPSREETIK